MKVKNSFWDWTGKVVDLDNDGWQDIYIGNRPSFGQHNKNIHSNIFYHNQKGLNFIQAEEEFGLINYTNTPGYTYLDFDLDGDIDIVSSNIMSTPSIYVNQDTIGAAWKLDKKLLANRRYKITWNNNINPETRVLNWK